MVASTYFRGTFKNETKESLTNVVHFPDMDPEIVKECMRFIYTGRVTFPQTHFSEFFNALEMLQLSTLMDLYLKFLADMLNSENFVEILGIALLFPRDELKCAIQQYLEKNFAEFINSKIFLELEQDILGYCLSVIHSWGAEFEELKWMGILNWMNRDLEMRKDHFESLFQSLDLGFPSRKYIKENILANNLVLGSNLCLRLVSNSLTEENRSAIISPVLSKMSHILTYAPESQLLFQYDITKQGWFRIARIPGDENEHFDITVRKGSIYVGTGQILYQYDGRTWKTLISHPELNTGSYNRCIWMGNIIYMIGPKFGSCYNIVNLSKSFFAGCGLGDGFLVTASESKIYVMNGYKTSLKAKEFNPHYKLYHPMTNMRRDHSYGAALYHEQKLYVLGGQSGNSVETYQEEMDRWCILRHLEVYCFRMKVFLGDKLYIFGGRSEEVKEIELDQLNIPEVGLSSDPKVDFSVCSAVSM